VRTSFEELPLELLGALDDIVLEEHDSCLRDGGLVPSMDEK
jgi:hypothetical protein